MVSQVFPWRFQVLILSLALLQALGEVRRQSHLDQWDNNMGFPMGSNGITFIKHMGYRGRWDNWVDTSSTAQGGGGSFKNRKPIGEVGCCESGMAKRIH